MNKNTILWLLAIGLVVAGLGTGIYLMARGIRNNNPGNIRHGSSQWQGMSVEQTDGEYIQFDDPVYGIRAMARLLKNYQSKYGLDTISEIISRWAPPNENITAAYVKSVSEKLGVAPDHKIDVASALPRLVPAIIFHENGLQPYSETQILKGIQLAG